MNTKAYIFDYGGTIDTAGCHWGKKLWHAYQQIQVPVNEQQFREAYVHAERTLGSNPIIKPTHTFHHLLDVKLRIELEFLLEQGYWNPSEQDYRETQRQLLDNLYAEVQQTVSHSRDVLCRLSERCPMVLVSNFYGNIEVVLREFQLDSLFGSVIESAVVGIRKPDHRIFSLGVEALQRLNPSLNLQPADITVVGDSFYKDILPARKAGCRTVWFKGEGWTDESYDETVPNLVITDLDQLL